MIVDRYYFQQHRMVWAVVGFFCGCLLVWVRQPLGWLAIVAASCILLTRSWYYGWREFFVFLLLFFVGLFVMEVQMQKFAFVPQQIGQMVAVSGTVVESRNGQSYFWFQSESAIGETSLLDGISLADTKFYVAVPSFGTEDCSDGNSIWYPAGTRLQLKGMLLLPQEQRNPGGFNEQQWFYGKGVSYKLLAEEMAVLEGPRGFWRWAWQVRQFITDTVEQFLPFGEARLALALLLGEKQCLEPEFYRLAQRIGVGHIFAVSGLHVGFVGGLLLLVLRRLGGGHSWLAFLLLVSSLSFYCLLVGFPPSALRAAAMLLLASLAQRLLRPINGIDFLAAIALLLLLDNPFLLFQAGFQLSFGVTLSLLVFTGPLQQKLQRVGWRWLRDSMAVVLAAYLASLPLGAWHFYSLSLFSPFCNFFLVPLVAITVPLLLLALLFTWFLPVAGNILFLPVRLLLHMLEWETCFFADWTGSGQYFIGRPSWLALVLYVLFLFLLWWFLKTRRQKSTRIFLFLLGLCLVIVGICWPKPPVTDELLYLDAGQGSCAVLRTAAGEVIVFDCGAKERELASCLAWYGINQIQAVILSHGDADHIAGLPQVLEGVKVNYLCVEKGQLQREGVQTLLQAAQKAGADIKAIDRNTLLHLQEGTVQLQVYDDNGQSDNSRELTALLHLPWADVAFPGDLSLQGVAAFVHQQQEITVWTVPHHGSRYSADEALYSALKAKGVQLAIISAGNNNSYGHPHQEVLQFLQQSHIRWQRTDWQGAILLRADTGKRFTVH